MYLDNRLMSVKGESFKGLRVLVMGLGLHGGGLESARFLAKRGAQVSVTDLRKPAELEPSIQALKDYDIDYILGEHRLKDFSQADIVIKNPAVRPDSPFLQVATRIETDISLFLQACPAQIIAVTGSKGKSSSCSALYHALKQLGQRVFLGGNITVSPLSFLDDVQAEDIVVLELSSWQLGDLRNRHNAQARPLLAPRVAIITSILHDHLDRYGNMESYVEDKKEIYRGQDKGDVAIFLDDAWGDAFAKDCPARVLRYAAKEGPGIDAFLAEDGSGRVLPKQGPVELFPKEALTRGLHQRQNLLAVGLALCDIGFSPTQIAPALASFTGIEHRLEEFAQHRGRVFYNDTAATIPEASIHALESFSQEVVLVCGGSDKELDFRPLAKAAHRARALVLFAGTASEKLMPLLKAEGLSWHGPFTEVKGAVDAAWRASQAGDIILLSPGCASFGLFFNEFDRGRRWKAAVQTFIEGDRRGH